MKNLATVVLRALREMEYTYSIKDLVIGVCEIQPHQFEVYIHNKADQEDIRMGNCASLSSFRPFKGFTYFIVKETRFPFFRRFRINSNKFLHCLKNDICILKGKILKKTTIHTLPPV